MIGRSKRRVGCAHLSENSVHDFRSAGGHSPLYAGGVCALLVVLSASLFAQDADSDQPLTLDEPAETTEPAPTPLEQQADSLPELVGRIIANLRDAESRLIAEQLDRETGELQERISQDLARLLQLLEQQASQPAPVPGEESPQSGSSPDSSATGGSGDPSGPAGDPSGEGESTEGDRPGELSDAELQRRRNLATSVWGHLPERKRDEMLGAFSERFLPAYDELVRQYYEALATRERQEQ